MSITLMLETNVFSAAQNKTSLEWASQLEFTESLGVMSQNGRDISHKY